MTTIKSSTVSKQRVILVELRCFGCGKLLAKYGTFSGYIEIKCDCKRMNVLDLIDNSR